MPPLDSELPPGVANNSSDFVRKLYKMLEDPQYNSVVRWGNDGDSFVVLENEKFTKTILPKHFKHSNFASFVRQLNKYDFHKVRHNDDTGQSAYGQGAWEFKHPEFNQHKKDNLDNIRRKAPAARKVTVAEEPFPATQQLVLLNDTLVATQHQVQALQEQYSHIANTNKILVDELTSLQKMVKAQHQVHTELINHLNNIDEQRRRNSRHAHTSASPHAQYHPSMGLLPDSADEPAVELRRAREILNNVATDPVADRDFERLTTMFQQNAQNAQNATSPPESAGSSSTVINPPAGVSVAAPGDLNDMRHLVYPVGQNAGIDPFHADHINNIPYTRPLSTANAAPPTAEAQVSPKELTGSLWGLQKPKILLVEDDKVCARIGAKFLSQVDCVVEIAKDGSEAVAKVNQDPERFDLIFMDIIMPVFDGVSATACIRVAAPRVPIVAMTSNIRSEDIATYFHWGMNDVLAKPFTKEGMVRILRKHLPYLLKNPPPPGSEDLAPPPPQNGYVNANIMPMQMGVKFETTPIQSPATSSSWHSPGTGLPQASPTMDGYRMNPGNPNPVPVNPNVSQDDRPEKRQRLYGPGQYA